MSDKCAQDKLELTADELSITPSLIYYLLTGVVKSIKPRHILFVAETSSGNSKRSN